MSIAVRECMGVALIITAGALVSACSASDSVVSSDDGGARAPGASNGGPNGSNPNGSSPSSSAPWNGNAGDGPPATCSAPTGSFAGLQMIECAPQGMTGKTGTPAPLVVALHGFTQQATAYADTTEWSKLAGRRGFYVIFPAAPGGRSFSWFSADRARDKGDSVGIMQMIEKMRSTHDIREDMIFATGLSAGGYMTTVLLATYPDVFAAGAAVAGGPFGCDMGCMSAGKGDAQAVKAAFPSWWNDASKRKPRLMIVQGDKDNVVSPTNLAATMNQWTDALGVPASPANASLGLGSTLKGYPYAVYSKDGHTHDVATVTVTGMAHGTPIEPGSATDQGGHEGSYTFAVHMYSPYYAAQFFGLVP